MWLLEFLVVLVLIGLVVAVVVVVVVVVVELGPSPLNHRLIAIFEFSV
jgi:hypothetical protein